MTGGLHHLELWVADLDAALPPWRWLLERLGWVPMRTWPAGASWRFGAMLPAYRAAAAGLTG